MSSEDDLEERRKRVEALYIAHARDVRAKLVRLGIHGANLDDLQQEVFVVALRRSDAIPEEKKAWLLVVAHNLARSYRKQRCHTDEFLDADAGATVPGEYVGELSEDLRRGLEQLDEVEWELVRRCALGGERVADVAAELGMALATAYTRLRAVKVRLWGICPSAFRPSNGQ